MNKLGAQGLRVSMISLHCMRMGQSRGAPDDAKSTATILRAVDLGVTEFYATEAFGASDDEKLLGRAMEGRRERAVITAKFGFRSENGKLAGVDSRPDHVAEVVGASFARLSWSRASRTAAAAIDDERRTLDEIRVVRRRQGDRCGHIVDGAEFVSPRLIQNCGISQPSGE